MNKQELKSLLENIYYTLTEAAPPPPPPPNPPVPDGWDENSPEPWPWPRNPTSPKPPPPPPPPPPLPPRVKPEPGDNPALLDEINRLLEILRQLERLDPIHHGLILQTLGIGSAENLRARIHQLLQILIRARQPLTA